MVEKLQEKLLVKPDGFDELNSLVQNILKESGLSENQQSVMKKCLAYLKVHESGHWFCDPYLYPIASHVLILFSFPEQVQTSWIRPVIASCILQCSDCCKGFGNGKYNLYKTFAVDRKIPISSVKQVIYGIVDWEITLIEPKITELAAKVLNNTAMNDADIGEITNCIQFCLSDANLFRRSKTIKDAFHTIWNYQRSTNIGVSSNTLTPGLVYLMFESNKLSLTVSETISTNLQGDNFDNGVVDEFSNYIYAIQNEKYYNEDFCCNFWRVCNLILSKCDPNYFIQLFNAPVDIEIRSKADAIRYFLLTEVMCNHLRASVNKPLPDLLEFLRLFCQRFEFKAWMYISPTSFANIIDYVMQNKYFPLFFSNNSPRVTLCILWVVPFCDSLKDSMRTTAVSRIITFLMSNRIFQQVNSIDTKRSIISIYLEILITSFDPTKLDIDSPSLELEILAKRDIRLIVDSYSLIFVNLIFQDSTFTEDLSGLKSKLNHLTELCFKFDLLILSSNSLTLQNGKKPKIFDTFPVLWSNIITINLSSTQGLVKSIFTSFTNACKIIKFIPKKAEHVDKELIPSFKKHNEQVELITGKMISMMDKISMLDVSFLLAIFENDSCLSGYWSCLFSNVLSQSGLSIIYQAFDVEGRFEGLQILLAKYLPQALRGVTENVKCLTNLGAYESCPKAVRLVMDVLKALTEPATGVLASETTKVYAKDELLELWSCCWDFLVMLYRKTLYWATLYHSGQLVEFTRDTLDLSHLLLDSYRIVVSYVDKPGIDLQLALQILSVFNSIIVWLRLGDMSLLNSCVDLVFKGFDLAEEAHVPIKKDLLILFIKYGARAKKFNNRLTQQQRTNILAKAREIDNDLVDEILLEIVLSHNKGLELTGRENSPDSDSKQPGKQQKITSFGTISKSMPAPNIPPSKEPKSSTLDSIKEQLKKQRFGPASSSSAPVAPPRPPGFNPKKPAVIGRSLNSLKKKSHDSSDEEEGDNEDDVDTSDLFIEKKKDKPKIVEIDMNGRPITKIARSKAVDNQQLEQQRMQMRLTVDLKGMYHRILKWNYNSLEYPGKDLLPQEETQNTFQDARDYSKTMEPLLMLECWAGIQSSKERGQEIPFEVFIGTRYSCDGFFDLNCTIKKSTISERQLTESDLIILGSLDANKVPREQLTSYLKAPTSVTCLAKINLIKSVNSEVADVTIRVASTGPMLSSLSPRTNLFGMKVMKMITIEREYSSLKGLEYYDLCDDILKAKPSEPIELPETEIKKTMSTYKLNHSQAKAILGTDKSKGFSLIQGPPGTGKTKTILGIVGYNLQQKTDDNLAPTIKASSEKKQSKDDKILICAPSNAAVDELVLRLKDGVLNSSGQLISPKVVRLGRSDAVNSAVKECTLEELVDSKLSSNVVDNGLDNTLKQEHIKLTSERKSLIEKKRSPNLTGNQLEDLENKIRDITKKRHHISQKLDEDREKVSIAYRTREIERRQVQAKILNEAQIICSTLSGSAHDFLASLYMQFNKVVIDEACQCIELSAIIPLRYGCHQCIMVGDPNQLPPTVLSQSAASYSYDRSLFVRMQTTNPNSVYLLDIQYRMHPSISVFPSKSFYDGKLKDGENMESKNSRPWHSMAPLLPYEFFNIVSSHSQNDFSKSLFNTAEATVALELVENLMNIIPQAEFSGKIGIVSPYKEQIRVIKQTFIRKFGAPILNEIDFNTVDGFQGQEKDIVIMSCVRANEAGGVGFLSDTRRMNVALTRARSTLWVLGNALSLSRNKNWYNLIEDAKSRNLFMDAYPRFLSNMSLEASGVTTGDMNSKKKKKSKSKSKSPVDNNDFNKGNQANGNHHNEYSSSTPAKRTISEDEDENVKKQKSDPSSRRSSNNNTPNDSSSSNAPSGSTTPNINPTSLNGSNNGSNNTENQNSNPPVQPSKSGVLPPRPPSNPNPGMHNSSVRPPKNKSKYKRTSSGIFINRRR